MLQVIVLAISMLAFVRNRATNVLPLILGLFFKISGISIRVMNMLSNSGVCVSNNTIERLKTRISKDAIQLTVDLITSGQLFYVIFDNINIFLRKSQQRLTNLNAMIHATNSVIITLPDIDIAAEDLAAKHAMRGERAKATVEDIRPDLEDETHMVREFQALITDMLVRYTPRTMQWEDITEMRAEVDSMMLQD